MNALDVAGLTVQYGSGRHANVAVEDLSLSVAAGQVLGLVGESGSGKSTVAKAVMGLVPVKSGVISVVGKAAATGTSRRARVDRARDMQLVFQDPYSSLDPRHTVRQIIAESLRLRGAMSSREIDAEVSGLLELVSLDQSYAGRLPRQLSGGQRQRVAIARALAVRPRLIIADEITSALDVSVQANILNLLRDIQRREGLSLLFISHNLATVRFLADQIAVMYQGRIVELGPVDDIVGNPQHEYTRALLAAVPDLSAIG